MYLDQRQLLLEKKPISISIFVEVDCYILDCPGLVKWNINSTSHLPDSGLLLSMSTYFVNQSI